MAQRATRASECTARMAHRSRISYIADRGAFFAIPFLTWCNVPAHTAIGTSAALGFPIAVFTTIANVFNGWDVPNVPQPSLGYVYLPALIGISMTSVLVAPFGARLAHRLPVQTLKRIFAVLLYALGARMLWGLLATS